LSWAVNLTPGLGTPSLERRTLKILLLHLVDKYK